MIRRMYLNVGEQLEADRIIQEKTGVAIKRRGILKQIFRRSSFYTETGENSNEIFEFIGDQVLSYYVVKSIAERVGAYSFTGDYAFRIRQKGLSNETLAKIIDEWGIVEYLLLGRRDIKNEVTGPKIKADLFKAIIGAIAVDNNWDSVILEKAVSKALNLDEKIKAMIESDCMVMYYNIDNAVTTLKETAERGHCTMPRYSFSGPDSNGYDKDGNPKWRCSCYIENEITALNRMVEATSKKEAKKAAAYLILCEQFGMQNKYGPNDMWPVWTYREGVLTPDLQSESL